MAVIRIIEFQLKYKPSHLLFRHLSDYVARGGHLNWEDRIFFQQLCEMKFRDESRHAEIVDLVTRLVEVGLIHPSTIQ